MGIILNIFVAFSSAGALAEAPLVGESRVTEGFDILNAVNIITL